MVVAESSGAEEEMDMLVMMTAFGPKMRITERPTAQVPQLSPAAADLLAEIRAEEGERVADPPLLFKVVVTAGVGILGAGVAGLVAGLIDVARLLA